MSLQEWNEMSVDELAKLHDEKNYEYTINDGRILWAHEG